MNATGWKTKKSREAHFAFADFRLGLRQLRLQRVKLTKSRHRHIQNRLHARTLQSVDDVGGHTGMNRGLYRVQIAFLREHHDGLRLVLADVADMLQTISPRRIHADNDDVRLRVLDLF